MIYGSNERIACACWGKFNGVEIYVSPNGIAHNMARIGEARNGKLISTPEMSDDEIEKAGLTGLVKPASKQANELHSFK